jgi:hypothetical protein
LTEFRAAVLWKVLPSESVGLTLRPVQLFRSQPVRER